MISQPSGSTVGFSGERLLLVIPDALRFSEKVISLSRFGSALPEAPFWRGSEPPGGRTQSGSEEHVPLQSAYSEIGFRARALHLLHFASDLPSGRSTMTDASGP